MAKAKKPYSERTDIERIESQWRKITGLHSSKQQSAAITRCASAAEIAANLAIRHEFATQSQFDHDQIDSFLYWANGIVGKMQHLLLPLRYKGKKTPEYKLLNKIAAAINVHRNAIVHQGEFRGKKTATTVIAYTKQFVETLVGFYRPGFSLPAKKK